MAILAILPESTRPASRNFLRRLPSSNQLISEARKEPVVVVKSQASVFYTFEAQLRLLGLIYTFRQPEEVLRFLEGNKFLIPLLVEAYFKIRNYFPNSRVFLEIDTDPEELNNQQLIAVIVTNFSPDEVLYTLKQLDEDWWLDALDRAQRKLSINVEFE